MFRVGSISENDLGRRLGRARDEEPTYDEVGATRHSGLPTGYRHDRHQRALGRPDCFERAKDGLGRWQPHIGAGTRIVPDAPPSAGGTVLVVLGLGPLQMVAPCRIVYVVDEPDRFGFAYGTLPGHPERGEESFMVERNAVGCTFRITAFSRPAQLLVRAGAPVARRIQLGVTGRYLDALARYVHEGGRT